MDFINVTGSLGQSVNKKKMCNNLILLLIRIFHVPVFVKFSCCYNNRFEVINKHLLLQLQFVPNLEFNRLSINITSECNIEINFSTVFYACLVKAALILFILSSFVFTYAIISSSRKCKSNSLYIQNKSQLKLFELVIKRDNSHFLCLLLEL